MVAFSFSLQMMQHRIYVQCILLTWRQGTQLYFIDVFEFCTMICLHVSFYSCEFTFLSLFKKNNFECNEYEYIPYVQSVKMFVYVAFSVKAAVSHMASGIRNQFKMILLHLWELHLAFIYFLLVSLSAF